MRPHLTLVLTGFFLLATAAPLYSRALPREAFSVRLDGYVGAKPAEQPIEVNWTVSLKGELYELFVSKLQVLTGNVAYYDLITALKPYRPALTITGDDEQLDMFATAPPGQRVSVIAFIRFGGGARYLMISNIEYVGKPVAVEPAPAQSGARAPAR